MADSLRKTSDVVTGAAVVVLALVVVTGLSLLQGAYNLDPHHWGLVLSNAVDLTRGRVPYREVLIQYGVLSALLPAGFFMLGGTQLSIIAGVAAFYALGIAGTYFISLQISPDRRLALYTFFTVLLVHPLAIYPWPNYLAYPFIVFGCLCIMRAERSAWAALLGGTLLGLSVLCRENLIVPISIGLLILPVLEMWCSGDKRRAGFRLISWLGFALPLGLFALCLGVSGLWHSWWQTAVELPKLYASGFLESETFRTRGIYGALRLFTVFVYPLSPVDHGHGLVIGLVLAAAFFFCCLGLNRTEARRIGSGPLFVAVLTGLLTSAALHIPEVFRLATGVMAGTALLFAMAGRFRVATPVFVICTGLLLTGWGGAHNGNDMMPTRYQIENGVTSRTQPLFAGQLWPAEAHAYYDWYDTAMRDIAARGCGVKYIRNETFDAYLEALSPFMQHQLMPFGQVFFGFPLEDWSRKLRPDYDVAARLRNRDIVIVTSRLPSAEEAAVQQYDPALEQRSDASSATRNPVPPPGFVAFSGRLSPRSQFLREGLFTLIWVPEACGVSTKAPPPNAP